MNWPIFIFNKNLFLRVRKIYPMRIRLFLFSFFFFLSILVTGQNTYPSYKQYTRRDGLSQMQVISLFQDSRGYIWAGTKEGVNCFNGINITKFTIKDGLEDNYGWRITEDFSGNIWVSTFKGFSSYDGVKWKSFPLAIRNPAMLAPTPDGKIWYLASNQEYKPLFGYIENGKFHNQQNLIPPLDVSVNCHIAYSKENNALVLTDNHNLYELKDGKVNKLLSVPEILTIEKIGTSILIFATDGSTYANLFEYIDGKVHLLANIQEDKVTRVGSASSDFTFRHPTNGFSIITLTSDTVTVRSFPETTINCCLTDQNGHLWLGAENGLLRVLSSGFETYKREVLPSVWSTVEDLDGNIWVASFEYGLKKYDGKTIQPISLAETEKLGKWFYFHPSVDKRGTLYFPNGLGVLTYNGQHFGHLNGVNCMTSFYDRDRDLLWVGSRKLIEVYDKNQKLIRSIKPEDGMELKGYVLSILKDNEGYYWLGGGSGLCRYNYDTRELVNYNHANGRLPIDGVTSAHKTPDGRAWFAGLNGLIYYDNITNSIRKIDLGEINGSVSFITAIDSTWLVFGQSEGIYLMDLQQFNRTGKAELHLFNENNGYMGIDPGQDGAMVDSKGNIWITSSSEVVKLEPRKLDFGENSFSVRIHAFNGQTLPYNQQQITLPRNNRSAVIQFDAVCFNRPNPVQYSWKIEGSGADWSAWQKEDYAVLTNLHNGIWNFQVRMKVSGLPIEETTESLFVKVNLALWKQDWFFPTVLGLVSLLVLFSITMLYRTRMRMLQVNKQAKMFQLQAILSQMNPHFIFNVMASLQSMIISANIEKANEYLVKMSNLVRGFLESSISTSISKSTDIRKSELPLQNTIEVIHNYIQFQQLIYPDKFDYEIFISPDIDPLHQLLPPMLIQPFVENAIRHGLLQRNDKGMLKVTITLTSKNYLNIEIADDGIGIKKSGEMIRRSNLLYTSRGKELTLNRIKLLNELGYNIQFDTISSDLGTKVTITIGYHEK